MYIRQIHNLNKIGSKKLTPCLCFTGYLVTWDCIQSSLAQYDTSWYKIITDIEVHHMHRLRASPLPGSRYSLSL